MATSVDPVRSAAAPSRAGPRPKRSSGKAAATEATAPKAPPQPAPRAAKSAPQRALERLGLVRDIDLALHLPLRYEDETRLTPIAELHDGTSAQVEGVVTDCRVQ